MPKALTPSDKQDARDFRRCIREKEIGILHLKKSDEILGELLKRRDVSKEIRLTQKGKKFGRFKHNFAESNTCYRAHGIKEYEPEIFERA
jgi:hypothetical protein